jgi:hypothetical protein
MASYSFAQALMEHANQYDFDSGLPLLRRCALGACLDYSTNLWKAFCKVQLYDLADETDTSEILLEGPLCNTIAEAEEMCAEQITETLLVWEKVRILRDEQAYLEAREESDRQAALRKKEDEKERERAEQREEPKVINLAKLVKFRSIGAWEYYNAKWMMIFWGEILMDQGESMSRDVDVSRIKDAIWRHNSIVHRSNLFPLRPDEEYHCEKVKELDVFLERHQNYLYHVSQRRELKPSEKRDRFLQESIAFRQEICSRCCNYVYNFPLDGDVEVIHSTVIDLFFAAMIGDEYFLEEMKEMEDDFQRNEGWEVAANEIDPDAGLLAEDINAIIFNLMPDALLPEKKQEHADHKSNGQLGSYDNGPKEDIESEDDMWNMRHPACWLRPAVCIPFKCDIFEPTIETERVECWKIEIDPLYRSYPLPQPTIEEASHYHQLAGSVDDTSSEEDFDPEDESDFDQDVLWLSADDDADSGYHTSGHEIDSGYNPDSSSTEDSTGFSSGEEAEMDRAEEFERKRREWGCKEEYKGEYEERKKSDDEEDYGEEEDVDYDEEPALATPLATAVLATFFAFGLVTELAAFFVRTIA